MHRNSDENILIDSGIKPNIDENREAEIIMKQQEMPAKVVAGAISTNDDDNDLVNALQNGCNLGGSLTFILYFYRLSSHLLINRLLQTIRIDRKLMNRRKKAKSQRFNPK